MKTSALVCALMLAAAPAAQAFTPSQDAIRAHMQFLSSDLLQGREAGTPGFDIAAAYVAAEFAKLGLKPAGDSGSYLQRVPLVTFRPAGEGSLVLQPANGPAVPLVFGKDYIPGANPRTPQLQLQAPLVFAGYGHVSPDGRRDDYAGLDVRGKIVVVLHGAPSGLQTEEGAHFRSPRVKRLEAEKRGAVGVLFVETPAYRRLSPFATRAEHWRNRSMIWSMADGQPFAPAASTPDLGLISLEGAAKLFAGAPATVDQIMTAAGTPAGAPPPFALPVQAAVAQQTETSSAVSSNVAGLIEGQRSDEIVVLSAHLDAVGVDATKTGDQIGNGAMDNATGIATMLEVGRAFKESGKRPLRSVLLLAVTAEEKGLVGADYFVRNPTVPKAAIAANVNLDMPILSYDFTDVVAFGAERSTIGAAARRAAARVGVKLSPDPLPEQGLFTRSDHYRFVEQGVPSVFLMTGHANGGAAAWDRFLKERYHKPSDDMDQPLNFAAAAKFASVNYELARELADTPQRPRWNRGDFFGTLFGGGARSAP